MLNDPRSCRQYRQVADQIMLLVAGQGLVPANACRPNAIWPSGWGVSRPSLREALVALEVEGQVEIRMGSGIYLLRPGHGGAAGAACRCRKPDGAV